MSSPFVAEIRMFAGNFAPPPVGRYVMGNYYPSVRTRALPGYSAHPTVEMVNPLCTADLQGSFPMFWGQGPGLSDYFLGQQSGTETVTLLQSEMPAS